MPQHQHYLPEGYLKAWCDGGKLIRYRRVGPVSRLVEDSCSPRGTCFEPGLYSIPPGGTANGLEGDRLELMLAKFDNDIPRIRHGCALTAGRVTDDEFANQVRHLMRIMSGRHPQRLRKHEEGIAMFAQSERPRIERLLDRALTERARAEARTYLSPILPAVAARAGLAAVLAGDMSDSWLVGDVHVVHAADVVAELAEAGLKEFPTYDPCVAFWEGPEAPIATFSVSPDLMVALYPSNAQVTSSMSRNAARQHSFRPLLDGRRALFVRRRLRRGSALWKLASAHLIPFDSPRTAGVR